MIQMDEETRFRLTKIENNIIRINTRIDGVLDIIKTRPIDIEFMEADKYDNHARIR